MISFLDGFDKRMEMVGIVESIVNRKNRNMELERLFKDNDFVNLVFSVLLFIMEKTLAEDSDCDADHIQRFIASILPEYYQLDLEKAQIQQLTQYILKNVLQNEGIVYHFETIDYTTKQRKDIRVRLITDHVNEINGQYKITYSLTDQGYDFLFRTKEVDQEIQMTIEELKLKELIKRKNFKKAQDQSQNLIQMVRQKKKEIQLFILKIKENIHDVDIDEFEKLMNSTYDLLSEEYDLLSEIMEMAGKSEERIRQEYEGSLKLDDSLRKAQSEIKQIKENIKFTLSEQRDLILNRQSLSNIYINTIGDSFVYSMENRFDMEELILKQMEEHADKVESFWKLVNPLFLPSVHKNINIRSIYEPQGMMKLTEEDNNDLIEEEVLAEDTEKEKIDRLNDLYVSIVDYLLSFTLKMKGTVHLAEVVEALKQEELFEKFMEDRLFFTTLLKLYDIGMIDIEEWLKGENRMVMNLSEEFNLEHCLYQILEQKDYLKQMKRVEVLNPGNDLIEVEVSRSLNDQFQILEKIEISNFIIKVENVGE